MNILEVCVTDRSGTIVFDRRGGALSGRAVCPGTALISRNVCEGTSVSVDDFVARRGQRPPDVVKIDVEGNEIAVIGGMHETLRSSRPSIIAEIHDHLGEDPADLVSLLHSADYRLYETQSWLRGDRNELRSLGGVSKVVALPPDAED